MTEKTPGKSERFNLRLSPGAKQRIERAASLEGKTATSFVLASALSRAEETIRKQETMALKQRDADTFFNALVNPPEPNARFAAALKKHSRRVISR